jgi:hypothetical protein
VNEVIATLAGLAGLEGLLWFYASLTDRQDLEIFAERTIMTLGVLLMIIVFSSLNSKPESSSSPSPDSSLNSNRSNIINELQKSCFGGNAPNCMKLGGMFEKSWRWKSEKYWEKACNLGDADGCYERGYPGYDIIEEYRSYSCGPQDDYNGCDAMEDYLYISQEARKWYKKSCDLGNNLACIEYEELGSVFGPMSVK